MNCDFGNIMQTTNKSLVSGANVRLTLIVQVRIVLVIDTKLRMDKSLSKFIWSAEYINYKIAFQKRCLEVLSRPLVK